MAVAQLAQWLLWTPEACGSNPVISKVYIENLLNVNYIEKQK